MIATITFVMLLSDTMHHETDLDVFVASPGHISLGLFRAVRIVRAARVDLP
jgi:hypothetical protein